MFDFQGPIVVLVNTFGKYSLFYPEVIQFEANSCVISIKCRLQIWCVLVPTRLQYMWIVDPKVVHYHGDVLVIAFLNAKLYSHTSWMLEWCHVCRKFAKWIISWRKYTATLTVTQISTLQMLTTQQMMINTYSYIRNNKDGIWWAEK